MEKPACPKCGSEIDVTKVVMTTKTAADAIEHLTEMLDVATRALERLAEGGQAAGIARKALADMDDLENH